MNIIALALVTMMAHFLRVVAMETIAGSCSNTPSQTATLATHTAIMQWRVNVVIHLVASHKRLILPPKEQRDKLDTAS